MRSLNPAARSENRLNPDPRHRWYQRRAPPDAPPRSTIELRARTYLFHHMSRNRGEDKPRGARCDLK